MALAQTSSFVVSNRALSQTRFQPAKPHAHTHALTRLDSAPSESKMYDSRVVRDIFRRPSPVLSRRLL